MRISYWSSDVCSSDLAMSYRDIMVHLTLDPRNAERTRFAIGLARRFNARISGLYTVPPPNVPYYMGEYIPTELIQKQMDEAQKATVAAREAFLATCRQAGHEHRWQLGSAAGMARGCEYVE